MDDVMESLENDVKSDLQKNTDKLDELTYQIKILNENVVKLIGYLSRRDGEYSYIS